MPFKSYPEKEEKTELLVMSAGKLAQGRGQLYRLFWVVLYFSSATLLKLLEVRV